MTREEEIYNQLVELFSAVDKQPKNFEFVFSKRQLNIAKEAEERYLSRPLHQYYSTEDLAKAFRDGAEWADMYPVNVWHDASEEPKLDQWFLAQIGDNAFDTFIMAMDKNKEWINWCKGINIKRWAYIKDLLPKN